MHNYYYLVRKCSLSGLMAGLAVLAVSHAAAQVDVGLSPMKVELPVVAGRSYSGSLSLTNSGVGRTRIRVEMVDFYVDENTVPQFIAHVPAEDEYSCRSWLSANPMELEVEPKTQVPVRYTVRVPAEASERSYHCALGFRTIPDASELSVTSMRTAVRMMSVFYPTIGKPSVNGVIRDLKLEEIAGAAEPAWRAVVVMENSGSMFYRPVGTLNVIDSSGKVVETQQLPSFPVLPKRQQRFVLPLKTSLSPGPYTLKARIEVGGEIQEASVAVTAELTPAAAPPPAGIKPPAPGR